MNVLCHSLIWLTKCILFWKLSATIPSRIGKLHGSRKQRSITTAFMVACLQDHSKSSTPPRLYLMTGLHFKFPEICTSQNHWMSPHNTKGTLAPKKHHYIQWKHTSGYVIWKALDDTTGSIIALQEVKMWKV